MIERVGWRRVIAFCFLRKRRVIASSVVLRDSSAHRKRKCKRKQSYPITSHAATSPAAPSADPKFFALSGGEQTRSIAILLRLFQMAHVKPAKMNKHRFCKALNLFINHLSQNSAQDTGHPSQCRMSPRQHQSTLTMVQWKKIWSRSTGSIFPHKQHTSLPYSSPSLK